MKRSLLLCLALATASCTLLTRFEPEGQPCDLGASASMQCLTDAGYFCSAQKVCTRAVTGLLDGGADDGAVNAPVDAGADAGRDTGADASIDAGFAADAGSDGG